MPGRISEYAALTASAAAPNDLIEVLDVSDTTMAPTGTNKKMALDVLRGAPIPRFAYNCDLLGQGPPYYRVSNQKGWNPTSIKVLDSSQGRVWMAWLPGQGGSLATLLVNIATAGDATAKIRLAVYAVNPGIHVTGSGLVGPLIMDSGQIDASTAGTKQVTGLNIPITIDGLLLAYTAQGATTTVPELYGLDLDQWAPAAGPEHGSAGGDIWGNRGGGIVFTGVTGAYPTQPTGISTGAAGIGYIVPDFKVQYR